MPRNKKREKRTRNSRVKILFHPRPVPKNPATTIDSRVVRPTGLLKNVTPRPECDKCR